MKQPRNRVPQEVPTGFANKLREMRDHQDPRLNAVLARARSKGWRTATLADVLGMNITALSKRIERSEPTPRETFARQTLRSVARKMTESGRADIGSALHGLAEDGDPVSKLADAADMLRSLGTENRKVRTALRNLDKARTYEPAPPVQIDGDEVPEPIEVPEPRRVQTMMNGQRLPLTEIEKLLEMKAVAKRVNGAVPADHPDRRVSEAYTAILYELIKEKGFTPYYLAKELGVTHRAITSRLERHGYRTPCPSVAGTPSGQYRGRKIGESAPAETR